MSATDTAPSIVVGLGRAGIGVARLLRAAGQPVVVLESRDSPELRTRAAELAAEGVTVRLATGLDAAAIAALSPAEVIVSPGIRFDHPALEGLRGLGVAVKGEMSPAWRATAAVPWIGITGTNGKTTVTQLVHHLLSNAGLDAPLCGNVGFAAAELALQRLEGPRPDWLVVELSSYQIEASPELAPRIGLWTTLTPDHLDRHGTLDRYRAIKRQLLEASEERILNADDADLRRQASSWDKAHWVTAGSRSDLPGSINPLLWVEGGAVCAAEGPLFPADALPMPGQHNRQNLLMATAVGHRLGLDPAVMEAAFRRFPGVPHRLERVRTHNGVTWTNDSKATNFDAAEVALRALEGPLVVLAGGQAKAGDPGAWLGQLRRQAAAVVLFGAAREPFTDLLRQAGYGGRLVAVDSMAEAVPTAAALAQELGCRAVLLSPACASFDQYSDFEARGHHFRQLVEQLPLTPAKPMTQHWLMKSEPAVYGIQHLEAEGTTLWDGIRNYQARNYMRTMAVGDRAFFYHSNAKPPGIAGLMEVVATGLTDPTQFDPSSPYYDPASRPETPRWDCVRLRYLRTFPSLLSLDQLRRMFSEEELPLLRRGTRLSVLPVATPVAARLLTLLEGG